MMTKGNKFAWPLTYLCYLKSNTVRLGKECIGNRNILRGIKSGNSDVFLGQQFGKVTRFEG